MTEREKSLARALLAAIFAALAAFLAERYLRESRELDSRLREAFRKIASYGSESGAKEADSSSKLPWSAAEAAPEVFLELVEARLAGAGWNTVSAVGRSSREGRAVFTLSLEGPAEGWGLLLASLASWTRQTRIDSMDASALGRGRMKASLELGYAQP